MSACHSQHRRCHHYTILTTPPHYHHYHRHHLITPLSTGPNPLSRRSTTVTSMQGRRPGIGVGLKRPASPVNYCPPVARERRVFVAPREYPSTDLNRSDRSDVSLRSNRSSRSNTPSHTMGRESNTSTKAVIPRQRPFTPSSPINDHPNSNLFATIEDLITKTDAWHDRDHDRNNPATTNPLADTRRNIVSLDDFDPTNEELAGYLPVATTESTMGERENSVLSSAQDVGSQSSDTMLLMSATRNAVAGTVKEEEDDDDITTERPIFAISSPPLSIPSHHHHPSDQETTLLLTTPTRDPSSNHMGLPIGRLITDTIPPFTSKSPVAKSPLTLQFESKMNQNHENNTLPPPVLVTTLLLPAFAGERTIHVASMHGAKVSLMHCRVVFCYVSSLYWPGYVFHLFCLSRLIGVDTIALDLTISHCLLLITLCLLFPL